MVKKDKSIEQQTSQPSAPSQEMLITYFNDLLYRLEELLLHELSGTAAKKVDFVGTDLIRFAQIAGDTIETVVEECIREIISMSLAENMAYSINGLGMLLKLDVKGCVHLSKEARLIGQGMQPYICPLANMIGDQILEKADYLAVNVAGIVVDTVKRRCIVKCAVFEDAERIGRTSDWT